MIGKSVESRAGTTEVVGSWRHPSMFTSNVDQLIFAESGEWDISWSALSLLIMWFFCFRRVSLFEMLFHELRVLKGSLRILT